MSENTITKETMEMVEEARKPGVFNLSDVIKGRGYPEREVTVYTDVKAAFRLVELEDKMTQVGGSDQKLYDTLEAESQEVAVTVQKSALKFLMRGVSQSVVEAVTKEADKIYKTAKEPEGEQSDDWFRFYVTSLVARNVVCVTDADGNIDETEFSFEEMLEIRNNLPGDSWGVLVNTMQKLTLATGYFKGLTDAGFLPKS
jgi:hypothetical protein